MFRGTKAAKADPAAWTAPTWQELVRDHSAQVYRLAYRLTGNQYDAEDLTQDVFVKAWQALPGWRPEARFSTWLLQIARNAALDQLRRRRVVQFAPLDDGMDVADTAPGPEARYASRQRQALLENALQQIAAEHREILLLREIEDLSYAELAAVLGIAEGTVKSRLARARAALLQHFRPHAGVRDD